MDAPYVTITMKDYDRLIDAAAGLQALTDDIIANIESGCTPQEAISTEFVLMVTGLQDYKKMEDYNE